jgi:hypothetical protein
MIRPGSGTKPAAASSAASLPFARSAVSSSNMWSKWSSMAPLPRPVTSTTRSIPAASASSTTYWTTGLSTTGIISLGIALVAGRTRVPNPATGRIAAVIGRLSGFAMLSIAPDVALQ